MVSAKPGAETAFSLQKLTVAYAFTGGDLIQQTQPEALMDRGR